MFAQCLRLLTYVRPARPAFLAYLAAGLVSEAGVSFSVGDIQRIAIARASLRNSPILVLDEPTSALDDQSERLVLDALRRLTRGHTALIVSHRAAPLLHVARVIRLENGRVVDNGTA